MSAFDNGLRKRNEFGSNAPSPVGVDIVAALFDIASMLTVGEIRKPFSSMQDMVPLSLDEHVEIAGGDMGEGKTLPMLLFFTVSSKLKLPMTCKSPFLDVAFGVL